MSASINRSLTTIKTELEFLLESEVISQNLYDHIIASLPERYVKGMPMKDYTGSVTSTTSSTPSGAATTKTMLDTPNTNNNDSNSNNNSRISINPPPGPPPSSSTKSDVNYEFAEAIYDYAPQQSDDLKLSKGDKVTVLEKLSDAWWKGSANGKVGVFPANYVKLLSSNGSSAESRSAVAPPPSYQQQQQPYYQQPVQQQYYQQPIQQPYYQQSSSTLNIPSQIPVGQPVQQQPQVVQVEQQPQKHHHSGLKKFGSKLGDAAIFGAGATMGSDLINSIF